MKGHRWLTKKWLKLAPLSTFRAVITEAKLSELQSRYFTKMFVFKQGELETIIKENDGDRASTIKREIAEAYDKVNIVLNNYFNANK